MIGLQRLDNPVFEIFETLFGRVASGVVETDQPFGYFPSLGRTSWLNQPPEPDTCEITQHLVFVSPLWEPSLQDVTSSLFYGPTHVSAMTLSRSATCPVKFYST